MLSAGVLEIAWESGNKIGIISGRFVNGFSSDLTDGWTVGRMKG